MVLESPTLRDHRLGSVRMTLHTNSTQPHLRDCGPQFLLTPYRIRSWRSSHIWSMDDCALPNSFVMHMCPLAAFNGKRFFPRRPCLHGLRAFVRTFFICQWNVSFWNVLVSPHSVEMSARKSSLPLSTKRQDDCRTHAHRHAYSQSVHLSSRVGIRFPCRDHWSISRASWVRRPSCSRRNTPSVPRTTLDVSLIMLLQPPMPKVLVVQEAIVAVALRTPPPSRRRHL